MKYMCVAHRTREIKARLKTREIFNILTSNTNERGKIFTVKTSICDLKFIFEFTKKKEQQI
jgi:hypothetical protein